MGAAASLPPAGTTCTSPSGTTHAKVARRGRLGDPRHVRRAGFALALALLAAVVGVAYQRLAQLRTDTRWSDHTHVVIEALETIRVAELAADSLRRSYRLSLDPNDRELMVERAGEADRQLDEVESLTRDNPSQRERAARLRPVLREREAVRLTGLDLPRFEALAPSVREEQRAVEARGLALAHDSAVLLQAMLGEEHRLLAEREAHALTTAQSARFAVLGGGALGLGLTLAFIVSLERENKRRRLAQDALEQSTLLVSAIVVGTVEPMAVKDRQGRYLFVNRAAASYLRRGVEDILGKTDAELMSPDAARTVMTNDRQVIDVGEGRVFEQHLVNDGEPRTFLSTKSPYRDAGGQVIGVIAVSRDITLRKQLELAVAEQAIRDPLTGLFNRRYLDEILAREIGRAKRREVPVSVVMIDIDHFKRMNDRHGHAVGDAVLKRFAEVLSRNVRQEDVPCRYGGEEFAVVLPEMAPDKARERAEELRAQIEKMEIAVGGSALASVSASLGIASFPLDGSTGPEVLRAADAALYRAKAEGRNRVVLSGP